MLGLGKKSGGAVKVKSEPEEMGCDMSGDDEGDAEIYPVGCPEFFDGQRRCVK